jgi:hypothetical protein
LAITAPVNILPPHYEFQPLRFPAAGRGVDCPVKKPSKKGEGGALYRVAFPGFNSHIRWNCCAGGDHGMRTAQAGEFVHDPSGSKFSMENRKASIGRLL